MDQQKKQWTKPQLIVLSRGTPEESVLLQCKQIGGSFFATATALAQIGCDQGDPGNCGACQSRGGS
jgi:hypothetical protein